MHVNSGASPLEASGGRTVRRELNRGGNRRANRALHGIVANRMCGGERIGRYIAGRMFEGKSKRDAMRCLERRVSERHAGSCSPRPPGDTPTVPSWPQGGNVSAPPRREVAGELGIRVETWVRSGRNGPNTSRRETPTRLCWTVWRTP